MHDPEQQTGEHETNCDLRIDAGPTIVEAVKVSDLLAQPREVQDAINAHQDVIIGQELAQRAGDEELRLVPLLAPEHVALPIPQPQ